MRRRNRLFALTPVGVVLTLTVTLFAALAAVPLGAQQSTDDQAGDAGGDQPGQETSTVEESVDQQLSELAEVEICGVGDCCPPSTQQKVMIGVGSLAVLVVLWFLLVRLMERRFINQDRSASVGRHAGISFVLFLTMGGMAALAYLITGCVHTEVLVWLGFTGVVFVIHVIYTVAVVRGS